jgi:hypothetical protein
MLSLSFIIAVLAALVAYPIAVKLAAAWLMPHGIEWLPCLTSWAITSALVAAALLLWQLPSVNSHSYGSVAVFGIWLGLQIHVIGWSLGRVVPRSSHQRLGYRRGSELSAYSMSFAVTFGVVVLAFAEQSLSGA